MSEYVPDSPYIAPFCPVCDPERDPREAAIQVCTQLWASAATVGFLSVPLLWGVIGSYWPAWSFSCIVMDFCR